MPVEARDVQLALRGNSIIVKFPFDAALVARIRQYRGRRFNGDDPANRFWTVPATIENAVSLKDDFPGAEMGTRFRYLLQDGEVPVPQESRSLAEDAVPGHEGLWRQQRQAYWWAMEHPAAMLDMGMGTGKSAATVAVVDNTNAKRVLILCPLAVCNVWPREFRQHGNRNTAVIVLSGSVAQKEQFAQYCLDHCPIDEPLVLVCNYDSAWQMDRFFLEHQWDIVILDESQRTKGLPRYKEGKPTAGKLAHFTSQLASRARRRICLSGTPMGHSPQDIFSQYRFLDSRIYGDSPYMFLSRYGIYNEKRYGAKTVRELVGWQRKEEMREKYFRIAYQCRQGEIELPIPIHEEWEVELSDEGRRAYDELDKEQRARTKDGDITAANGAVEYLRLQQVASGWSKTEDGKPVEVDTAKKEAIAEILEDLDPSERVVVCCQFTSELQAVRDVCAHTNRVYGEISGNSKDGLGPDAKFNPDKNVVGVQIQAGGVGVDLTLAAYCIILSPGMSLSNWEQFLKRQDRPGQTRQVTYIHVIATKTKDRTVYRALQEHKDVIESIIGEYAND